MLQNVCRRLALATTQLMKSSLCETVPGARRQFHFTAVTSSDNLKGKEPGTAFDLTLLDYLVCPLSRKPLRYEESTNELINEELGIAYPVLDGIPNMIPQDARMIHRSDNKKKEDETA